MNISLKSGLEINKVSHVKASRLLALSFFRYFMRLTKDRQDIVFERYFSLTVEDMDVRASENLGGRPGGLPRMSENAVSCLSEYNL
ncbi:MAG: hypothetical protein HY880_06900 [Deltaproteobacteria bacterium]|nr:hypothetical protein [Deltaproteobacteria bacterium]